MTRHFLVSRPVKSRLESEGSNSSVWREGERYQELDRCDTRSRLRGLPQIGYGDDFRMPKRVDVRTDKIKRITTL